MKIVYFTAGAAGMYCGSCMHDNSLARAMRALGDDVLLQPLYTPIRTDEVDVAGSNVFFGGIQVYALQMMPWLSRVPRFLRSWMDHPTLIRWATSKAAGTDPSELGELTLSMLRGQHGNQSDEVNRVVDWLANEIQPDAVIFSNLLIGGVIPQIRDRLPNTRVIVVLQGDDIFLDHLPDEHRSDALELCRALASQVQRFVCHSRFYQSKMGELLAVPDSRIAVHPLSIEMPPWESKPARDPDAPFRVGYFARIAPEKGLHVLADAFIELAGRPGLGRIELHAAGWLGEHRRGYLDAIQDKLKAAGLGDRFTYHGSPDLKEKRDLLRSFDVLSVPAPYEDPKGLFILEALAVGTPVVQPDHGAFGELVRSTGGGHLVPAGDTMALADAIAQVHHDTEASSRLLDGVHEQLMQKHSIQAAAAAMRQACLSMADAAPQ